MSDWPDTLKVGPIGQWPGTLTSDADRRRSPFGATLGATLKVLEREIYNLVDTLAQQKSAELLIAIPAGRFRIDGRPYADARAEHPGVIFSIDSRYGHVSYPCDTFTTWQDNLRAIALALEALRKVDRYGVTKRGEQYRGFLALEATAMPAGFTSVDGAIAFLNTVIEARDGVTIALQEPARILRRAKWCAHPDTGGDAVTFQRVTIAEQYLTQNGVLT